jgi:hypothetical protein
MLRIPRDPIDVTRDKSVRVARVWGVEAQSAVRKVAYELRFDLGHQTVRDRGSCERFTATFGALASDLTDVAAGYELRAQDG